MAPNLHWLLHNEQPFQANSLIVPCRVEKLRTDHTGYARLSDNQPGENTYKRGVLRFSVRKMPQFAVEKLTVIMVDLLRIADNVPILKSKSLGVMDEMLWHGKCLLVGEGL